MSYLGNGYAATCIECGRTWDEEFVSAGLCPYCARKPESDRKSSKGHGVKDPMDLRKNLDKLNSVSKYPSILTYHVLGGKGRLTEEVQVSFANKDNILVTEKVDGTNARIFFLPYSSYGTFLIGSRDEILHCRNDVVFNPSQGIVEGVRAWAELLLESHKDRLPFVVFGEVYGGKVNAHKNYTGEHRVGFRVFDAIQFNTDLEDLLEQPREKIAAWREHGGQPFVEEETLRSLVEPVGLELTPRISANPLPTSVEETLEWLQATLPEERTLVALDEKAKGKSEGVVVRTPDRSTIAKLRFEDYHRTLKQRKR